MGCGLYSCACFNPRICKRCDGGYENVAIPDYVSIHASVKDATSFDIFSDKSFSVSIHASVKDATLIAPKVPCDYQVSIHASVKDATALPDVPAITCPVSIHASVKDATLNKVQSMIHQSFNPRICKRCDSR